MARLGGLFVMIFLEKILDKAPEWSAVIVAAAALFVAYRQWAISRHHNKISVAPMLKFHIDCDLNDAGIEYSVILENVGLGTAYVTDRYFTLNDQRFAPNNVRRTVRELCAKVFDNNYRYIIKSEGMVGAASAIPAGARIVIAKIFFAGVRAEQQEQLENVLDQIDMIVECKCAYGQKYSTATISQDNHARQ